MTGLRSLVHVGLAGSRWLLPWMSILLVSAAIAYAMNGALTRFVGDSILVARSRNRAAGFRSACHRHRGLRHSTCRISVALAPRSLARTTSGCLTRDSRGPCGLGVAVVADPPSDR